MEEEGDSTRPPAPRVGAGRTREVQGHALMRLARATIGLSQVAPRLSELAATRQAESERQAERARDVTALARQMADALGQTVGMMRSASNEIADLTHLIRRVADETSLIAINTGVAAARAGEDGRAFTVLAREIRSLSERTSVAARDVEAKIRRLRESTESTARVVGLERSGRVGADAGLTWLIERMGEAERSAALQAQEAGELTTLGGELRALAEDMIRSVGAFRLEAHRRAEAMVESLRIDPDLASSDARRVRLALARAVERASFVELAYATDSRGTQLTENIAPRAFQARYGETGKGRDWSTRSWFVGAMRAAGVFSSEIYTSAATGEFCLTVSAPFGAPGAAPRGVVALDLNFRELLGRSA